MLESIHGNNHFFINMWEWKAQANPAVHQAYTLVPNTKVFAIPDSVPQPEAFEWILHGSHMLTVNNKMPMYNVLLVYLLKLQTTTKLVWSENTRFFSFIK